MTQKAVKGAVSDVIVPPPYSMNVGLARHLSVLPAIFLFCSPHLSCSGPLKLVALPVLPLSVNTIYSPQPSNPQTCPPVNERTSSLC